jgi:hypothetical protein
MPTITGILKEFVSNNLGDSQTILWSLKGQGIEMFLFFYEWVPPILPCMHFLGTVSEFFSNLAVSSRNHARIYVVLYRVVSVLSVMFIPGSCCLTIRSVDSFVPPCRFRNQISKSVHISSPLWSWFTQRKTEKNVLPSPCYPVFTKYNLLLWSNNWVF